VAPAADESGSNVPIAVVYDKGSAAPGDIIRSLGDAEELVIVLADSETARSVRILFESCSRAVLDLTEDDLPARLQALGVTGIVTYSERMLRATADLAARCGLPYSPPTAVAALTDKTLQRRALRDGSAGFVASAEITSVDGYEAAVRQVGLPAVIKPAQGESSRNTLVVRTSESGRQAVAEFLAVEERLVMEEFLQGTTSDEPFGDYVSVESAILPSGPVQYAITGKFRLAPPFRESGQFWPARLDENLSSAVRELTSAAITALGMTTGLAHTEIKLTADGPRIIEVNGRLGGHQPDLARRATGLDIVRLGADIALGRPVELAPVRPDRVYFQLLTPGPTENGTLRRVWGGREVLALPGVTVYRPYARQGTAVGGTSSNWLDLTCGVVDTHAELPAMVRNVSELLHYEFDISGDTVVRTAADLLVNP
jgi:biotin carboxylase